MGGADDTTVRRAPRTDRREDLVATLRIVFSPKPHGLRSVIALSGETTIGRGDACDVALSKDAQLSRVHATISAGAGGLRIVDVSTNGTYVNGGRIRDLELADGDVIRAGDTLMLVREEPRDLVKAPEAHGLDGDSPAMHELRRSVALIAAARETVLVMGETGTGKELVARAIHAISRPDGPFVAVNCAAIPESLAESQLFGHVAGAFTGARGDSVGMFRAASGGVLFLDELGELAPALQAKLLRAVEEKRVTPVGSIESIPFDARVVAATNREIDREVAEGRFRADLHARLGAIEVRVPPLRDRIEDVLPLLVRALGGESPPLSADLAERCLLYHWPYNVRELLNVAADLRVRGKGLTELPLSLVEARTRPRAAASEPVLMAEDDDDRPIPTREELCSLLREHGGRVADVARATGRSRKQVYRWLKSHAIDLASFRAS